MLWTETAMHDGLAIVICRQMGWKTGRLLELSIVKDGDNQIWMDNVNCIRTETHVEQCQHGDYSDWQWAKSIDGNCATRQHLNDIGVGCDQWDATSQSGA